MTNIAARASLVVAAACALGALAPAAHAEFAYDIEFTGTFEGNDPILKLANGVEEKFRHDFTNTGDEIDLYRMWMTAEYYTGDELGFTWTMCTTSACVLPGVESTVGLAPAESDTVTIKITPSFDQEGSATVTLYFESVGNPALGTSFRYSVIREGTDVLILDDDGEAALEQYVAAGLEAAGTSYGVYDTSIQPLADASFGFDDQRYLVYVSGDESVETITGGDGAALGTYLDGGGRLIASGQDLFDDITGTPFCETYLGTSAIWPTSETLVTGVTGDALGDGLSFSIAAGAMNQVSPDVLLGGIDALRYGDGSVAGVRHETPVYKTVSLGFGLEALSPSDLAAFLGAAESWFDAAVVTTPEPVSAAPSLAAAALPNPMRSGGVVRIELAEEHLGRVRVSFFDATGRWLASPLDAVVGGGMLDVPVPFERLRGAGPGLYFYEVVTAHERISGKLTTID